MEKKRVEVLDGELLRNAHLSAQHVANRVTCLPYFGQNQKAMNFFASWIRHPQREVIESFDDIELALRGF